MLTIGDFSRLSRVTPRDTVVAVYRAVAEGRPLMERIVTVSTLFTTQPTSAGSMEELIFLPVTA